MERREVLLVGPQYADERVVMIDLQRPRGLARLELLEPKQRALRGVGVLARMQQRTPRLIRGLDVLPPHELPRRLCRLQPPRASLCR